MYDLLETVAPIIIKAGRVVSDNFRKTVNIENHPDGDVATNMDIKANEIIISSLSKKFPDYGIISEESKNKTPNADNVWILDPIDGSKHYAIGNPLYGISLALQQDGEICFGIVYFPANDELFHATTNQGAFLNNKRIFRKNDRINLKDAIICVEIPSRHDAPKILSDALARFKKLILNCQRVRIVGISSFGMCYCASGGFDGYVSLGCKQKKIWDIAGGEIIMKESGCLISHINGAIVAGNSSIYDKIIKLLF